jgi:hypothetical protein
VKQRRRLRRLVPDADLFRRRAAGEPLRELASDYGVAHTTLSRFFERPDVAKELKQAVQQRRDADRARNARVSAERRLEREVRRKAREQAEREKAWRASAASAERALRQRPPRTSYEAWLDERDARMPLTRAELHSQHDVTAARVVAEGGGIEAVLDATDLRTLENVVGSIDPAILVRAYDNDALARSSSAETSQ